VDFWVWLVILFIAWALEAIANAGKKKRPPPESRRLAPRPRVQRPAPPPARARAPARMPPAPPPPVPRLPEPFPSGELEAPWEIEVPVPRAPRPREVEATEALEGVSAEALAPETAPEAAHLRAVAKYGPVAGPLPAPARRRGGVRRIRLHDAIVWREILGPPKGW